VRRGNGESPSLHALDHHGWAARAGVGAPRKGKVKSLAESQDETLAARLAPGLVATLSFIAHRCSRCARSV
jgi:hypothetical protein